MSSSMRQRRVVDERDGAVDDLADVVRRDVGRHADGDAGGAVDEEVGNARRKDLRLELLVVVVRLPVDGFFVDVGEHLGAEPRHAHFGVTHGRRRIAVDGAPVALAVAERVAQREVLRHAHDGVVDRRVAVRVELAHAVADDARRLQVGAVPVVVELVLRVEDAAVDRLQAVAHVGQRARDDDRHRVVHEGRLHLVLDGDGQSAGRRKTGEAGVSAMAQRSSTFWGMVGGQLR